MPEIEENKLSEQIKFALKKRGGNLEGYFNQFFLSAAMKNMLKIAINKETQASDYRLFLERFKEFLDKELLNKEPLKQAYPGQKFRDLVSEESNLSLKQEGFIEDKITEKKENEVYLKILTLLADLSFEKLTISRVLQIFNAIEFFLKSDFFHSVDILTKMNAIYFSLTEAEPLETANFLARLSTFDLLIKENLKKIIANSQLNISLFSSVLNKLSLNGGENHLLTQANLDKLLDNPKIDLDLLAKFIQADDESTFLTQEKFDLAINLKNLLTQDSIDQLIALNEADFEKIVPELIAMHKNKILNDDNVLNFLNTFRATRIYDEKADLVDSAMGRQSSKPSLTDKFCKMLKDFLDKAWVNAQVIFDKIIDGFNKITKRCDETQDAVPVISDETTSPESYSPFFANSARKFNNIDPIEELPNLPPIKVC